MTSRGSEAIATTFCPTTVDEVAQTVRAAAQQQQAIYPIGGATSLDFGLPIQRSGWGLSTSQLDHVIDYPAADMTITVQAGMRMERLDEILRTHQQRLPLDVPQASLATLGGVLATNWSGPWRFGWGTARDHVIGIQAVDGRGEVFAGGGRVVKNVAGYDFCKLLIGSFGTLGVITEVTLKLKPRAAQQMQLVIGVSDRDQCDKLVSLCLRSIAQPVAIEWIFGREWQEQAAAWSWPASSLHAGWLVLMFEGTDAELQWMRQEIAREMRGCGVTERSIMTVPEELHEPIHRALREFPAQPTGTTLLKFAVPSSALVRLAERWESSRVPHSWQAHAGNGIAYVRLEEPFAEGLPRAMLQIWQPWAIAAEGSVVVVRTAAPAELTPRVQWGETSSPRFLMQRVRDQFDPQNILNPQRFRLCLVRLPPTHDA